MLASVYKGDTPPRENIQTYKNPIKNYTVSWININNNPNEL